MATPDPDDLRIGSQVCSYKEYDPRTLIKPGFLFVNKRKYGARRQKSSLALDHRIW